MSLYTYINIFVCRLCPGKEDNCDQEGSISHITVSSNDEFRSLYRFLQVGLQCSYIEVEDGIYQRQAKSSLVTLSE